MSTGRPHSGASGSAPLLFGRERELARVRDLFDGVSDGGGALVVRGEAGVGKSALLEEAVAWGRERRFSVLAVTGVQSEARLAFAGLHQLLHPFLGAFGRLPGPQRGALETAFGMSDGQTPDVFLIALAALGVIADAAVSAPLLLVVDDAQWVDALSCEVLGFVGRRIDVEPVILLIGVRDGVSGQADALGLPELRLSALADEAARALLSSGAGDFPADLQARVLREAAGNPLALIELPRALSRRQDDHPAPQDPLPLTARLEEAFAARISELPADTRLLLLLAALDDGGETEDLLRAADLTLGRPVSPGVFGPAVDARLCTVEHGRVRFWHPLVRSAVRQAAGAVMPGLPAYRARTQLAYGTWLRRRRRTAESRAPLREAADAFNSLGSLRLADRAQRELRASGETARERQPEARDRLTPQELQIAQLAAEGLSNRAIGERLYLSHRTVGFHLYKLFPKLGVTSRTELRAVLEPAGGPA